MFRLLFLVLGLFSSQAIELQKMLHSSDYMLRVAHFGISKKIDVSWEHLKQAQDHYKHHPPQQIRNTDTRWSVDHAFKFLLQHGHQFKKASFKAHAKGIHFKGELHGTHYDIHCENTCSVHHGKFLHHVANRDAHDDLPYDAWLKHRERQQLLKMKMGDLVNPEKCTDCNCLRLIVNQDCHYHNMAPLKNYQRCIDAVRDILPEIDDMGLKISKRKVFTSIEVATAPDCTTDGHAIVFNKRDHNIYVDKHGTIVDDHTPGAKLAPWDKGCTENAPCVCQFTSAYAHVNHTGRVMCSDMEEHHFLESPVTEITGDDDSSQTCKSVNEYWGNTCPWGNTTNQSTTNQSKCILACDGDFNDDCENVYVQTPILCYWEPGKFYWDPWLRTNRTVSTGCKSRYNKFRQVSGGSYLPTWLQTNEDKYKTLCEAINDKTVCDNIREVAQGGCELNLVGGGESYASTQILSFSTKIVVLLFALYSSS